MKTNKEKLSLNSLKQNIVKNIGMNKIILLILAGVLLLITSIPTGKDTSQKYTSDNPAATDAGSDSFADYEEYMEKRLKKLLAGVDGVGKIDVMITFKKTSEKILVSEDSISENTIKETDSSGGKRDSRDYSLSQSYIYDNKSDSGSPYVKQEIKPEAEGVVVIAQGGDNPQTVANITAAVEALLGVPVHKIQVLKMTN